MRSPSIAALLALTLAATTHAQKTYLIDCRPTAPATSLHTLDAVNALALHPGDQLLFERGTTCAGSLHLRGEGITLAAHGAGPLPRIEARAQDEATLTLVNPDHVSISGLDLRGGTTYGLHITGDRPVMRDIQLSNITVSGVRGRLKQKSSGLLVIAPSNAHAHFEDLTLDGIRAFNTTQWSGIFVSGATRAVVSHSLVHDVQGDGIVLFESRDSRIEHSVAWHTGMQAVETIGTPNAIWTWRCDHCTVADNEAFLTDSPGIDGGAFDIDWGNTANSVTRNYGHDTQGYCVSVFAANGPTLDSTVDHNVCLNNGLSPRLAQRQGAILLMTWNGGTLQGVDIAWNLIDWNPPGDAPIVQTGAQLSATGVGLRENEMDTSGSSLVSPTLHYIGGHNTYILKHATAAEVERVAKSIKASEPTSEVSSNSPALRHLTSGTAQPWRLLARLPQQTESATLGDFLLHLRLAALQYPSSSLAITLAAPPAILQSARDWELDVDGILLEPRNTDRPSLQLISPANAVTHTWQTEVPAIDFGLTLRQTLGPPSYSRLTFESIPATD